MTREGTAHLPLAPESLSYVMTSATRLSCAAPSGASEMALASGDPGPADEVASASCPHKSSGGSSEGPCGRRSWSGQQCDGDVLSH